MEGEDVLKATITSIEFTNEVLSVKGQTDFAIEQDAIISLRKRDDEYVKYNWKESSINMHVRDRKFEFQCGISQLEFVLENNLKDRDVWDFFLRQGNDVIFLSVEDGFSFTANYIQLKHPLFKTKPYITGKKGLSLFVVQNDIQAVLQQEQFFDGIYDVGIKLKSAIKEQELQELKASLLLKRREQKAFFEYYEQKKLELVYNDNLHTGLVDLETLFKDYPLSSHDLFWDLFIELSYGANHVHIPVTYENQNTFGYHILRTKPLHKVKPISDNQLKTLCITSLKVSAAFSEMTFHENILSIKGSVSSSEIKIEQFTVPELFLILKKRTHFNKHIVFTVEKQMKIQLEGRNFQGSIDLSDMLATEHICDNDVWDIFVRFIPNHHGGIDSHVIPDSTLGQLATQYEILKSNSQFKCKPYVNATGKFSLIFRDVKKAANPVKVAVFGSCYCRSAFNSDKFFNPDYKNYYNCVYTQFHSSVISIMSKPVALDETKLDKLNHKQKEFIRCDFDKGFFERLKSAQPDYLLMDFFADASRNLIKVNDGGYISISHILDETPLENELIKRNEDILSHENNDAYFVIWKEAIDRFIEQIQTIIPQERIILNLGRFTDRYYDSEGNVVHFPKYRQTIVARNNYLWDKLNHYLISKLPKMKIIDLTNKNFIGHYNHPLGLSPAHYESAYYKEFLNELNQLVMKDFITNKTVVDDDSSFKKIEAANR
jgi:hypothetical protein